jgi:response regulator RpfG family c-di-GMP phosphodiesterase
MKDDDDDWMDEDEGAPGETAPESRPWRILIVDDEPDIHSVTKMALASVTFKNRSLELLSAYSGKEGFEVLTREPNIALVLLDVVMENDEAGLQLAKRIRGELNNQLVRIVLRTGQPGQAPEERVIVDFDINDYKAKTELTKQKLFTTVIASLRGYEGLVQIERNRVGLAKILQGSSNLYEIKSLKEFASGVLSQIGAILDVGTDGVLCVTKPDPLHPDQRPEVVAATGEMAKMIDSDTLSDNNPYAAIVTKALQEKQSQFEHPVDVLFIHAKAGHEFAIVLTPPWPLGEVERSLLQVYCDRIASAFDNLHMYDQLQKAQEATVVGLADLGESRDENTGGHVKRVCRLTDAIAKELKEQGKFANTLTPEYMSLVGLAAMLHDIGKVATPDAILLKPGRHTPEERAIMEQHADIGEKVLRRAAGVVEGASYLTIGAEIAGGHHEHIDGTGYPRKLMGEAIPLGARIVAVVDVFDALLHSRPYKQPWPVPEVFAYLEERRGKQFDPDVIDALKTYVDREQPDWITGDDH